MHRLALLLAAVLLFPHAIIAGIKPENTPQVQALPPLREQAEILDAWTAERKALIPGVIEKYGVDAWLISQREYAEDTVFWALKEATYFSARRRTVQLFLANSSTNAPLSYYWIDNTPQVWEELRVILEEQQPRSIALNTHSELAFSGGLHAGERDAIVSALGSEWADRFVLEPMIAIEVVATMVPSRLPWYIKMMETAWAIIEEAFSSKVIVAGRTTTWDVEWWMREKIQALNYTTWFQPSVYILNKVEFPSLRVDDPRAPDHLIKHGDIIHCDFGVTALGLNTDTQHIAYVGYPGETSADIPKGVVEGLRKVNRLQDITKASMKIGMTGNEILKNILSQAQSEGIHGKIYCHATGEFGHSAGTVIGMTNLQEGVPFLGELPLLKDTYYSIELYAEHLVPEKNLTIRFPQEEDVYWNGEAGTWNWVFGQQTELLFVESPADEGIQGQAEL